MTFTFFSRVAAASLGLAAGAAFGHDSHGLGAGAHWHATDTLGLLLGAMAVAVVVWFSGRGK